MLVARLLVGVGCGQNRCITVFCLFLPCLRLKGVDDGRHGGIHLLFRLLFGRFFLILPAYQPPYPVSGALNQAFFFQFAQYAGTCLITAEHGIDAAGAYILPRAAFEVAQHVFAHLFFTFPGRFFVRYRFGRCQAVNHLAAFQGGGNGTNPFQFKQRIGQVPAGYTAQLGEPLNP